MKSLRYLLPLLLWPVVASAQVLVKDAVFHPEIYTEGYYDVEPDFVYKNEFRVETQHCLNEFAASYQFEEMELKLPADFAGRQVIFFGHHDTGQYAVTVKTYDDGSADYVLHMYNNLDRCYQSTNLSDLMNRFSRITHLTYFRGYFYFNMEAIDGEVGDPEHTNFYYVYCFDPQNERICWESPHETCRGEFLLTDDYVLAGFGGSDCPDFVTLLNRENGYCLGRVPVPTQPTAVGMAQDSIYFTDYQGELYRYLVKPRGVLVNGRGVRLRKGPGTEFDIFTDPYTTKTVYMQQGDILAYEGETADWFQVRYMAETLYISKQFSDLYEGLASTSHYQAYLLWQKEKASYGAFVHQSYAEIEMPMDSDEGAYLILTDNSEAAILVKDAQNCLTFVTEGEVNCLSIYQEVNAVRYYFGNAIGLENDHIYIIDHGRIAEIWMRNIEPLGNIREEDEVPVKIECTHTVNGKTLDCSDEEFDAIHDAVCDSPVTELSDLNDL